MTDFRKIHVEDYYQQELFRFIPEDMFELLDQAYFWKNTTVKVPKYLIEEFELNKKNVKPKTNFK